MYREVEQWLDQLPSHLGTSYQMKLSTCQCRICLICSKNQLDRC